MKKLLFIPMLFACYMSMGQASTGVSPTLKIGTDKIGVSSTLKIVLPTLKTGNDKKIDSSTLKIVNDKKIDELNKGKHFIGEEYGGGIVFYIYDDGNHGLIASKSDMNLTLNGATLRWFVWSAEYVKTGASEDGVGTGLRNTEKMIESEKASKLSLPKKETAASICRKYSVTVDGVTYNDWYLPSLWELHLLFLQRKLPVFNGGSAGQYYWSSDEYNKDYAYFINFQSQVDGLDAPGPRSSNVAAKLYPNYIHAVRSF
jgi:hypothetical protein